MTPEELANEILLKLKEIYGELLKSRRYEDQTVGISSSQPYVLDYQNMKHVFIFSQTAIVLASEDFTSTWSIPANTWTNLGLPQGSRLLVPAAANVIYIHVRCTDEVIP